MIKSVIFDIDNTLYDYDHAHAIAMRALEEYMKEQFCWEPEKTEQEIALIYRQIQDEIGQKAACHNRLIRFQRLLEQNELPLHPHALNMYDIYWDTLIRNAKLYPGVEVALSDLKKAGYALGIGTNMTARIQFRKLTAFGLLQYFDFIVSSEEADREKPQKDIFSFCAKKAHCLPSQCVYVGDSMIHDIIGAQGAGMHPLWFRPIKNDSADGQFVPAVLPAAVPSSEQVPVFSDFHDLFITIQKLSI